MDPPRGLHQEECHLALRRGPHRRHFRCRAIRSLISSLAALCTEVYPWIWQPTNIENAHQGRGPQPAESTQPPCAAEYLVTKNNLPTRGPFLRHHAGKYSVSGLGKAAVSHHPSDVYPLRRTRVTAQRAIRYRDADAEPDVRAQRSAPRGGGGGCLTPLGRRRLAVHFQRHGRAPPVPAWI